MPFINSIFEWAFKKRSHQIELFLKYPIEVQNDVLSGLLSHARDTEWGKKFDFESIKNHKEFSERIPLSNYEDIFEDIERLMKGEKNILWPGKVSWFAKSSGTTNARSKFIPVTPEALEECHYKGGKDMVSLYMTNYNQKSMFSGKSLTIGGSHQINPLNPKSKFGDVSAVIMQNLPVWAKIVKTPSLKVAVMDDWEKKIDAMAEECAKENVTSMAGVPTWTIVLLQRIIEKNQLNSILDVWPNLEIFVHGAVAFEPYRKIFQQLIPSSGMNYQEVYNASEGFFGIQNDPKTQDMLLMLDYGVFYEFIPMDLFGEETEKTITLSDVKLNTNYALVISTNAGLWRYKIGDTIRFTSLSPYKIKITGRTKHFMNAFGEEIVIENADEAIKVACEETASLMSNYTASPVYFGDGKNGSHEWLLEFEKAPEDLDKFTYHLDKKLREINSDYDAKRYKDIALSFPIVHQIPQGGFYQWLKSKGKIGGQYKVPRLSNNRIVVDEIKALFNFA